MKKFFLYILILVFFITSFFIIENKQNNNLSDKNNLEKRAVFLSYLELNKYIKNKTSDESKANIKQILTNMNNYNLNMLILHVRPFSDAIYKSNIFPSSSSVVSEEGEKLPYDFLQFIIEQAKEYNIEVHAWINPYRIRSTTDVSSISKDNPAYDYLGTNAVKVINEKGIYYNPANDDVNKLLVEGIEELVRNYDVAGIHFDDYFYPDAEIDLENYQKYIESGGTLSLTDYRYDVVSNFIRDVYSAIKNINKDIVFGISPEGNIENDYKKHYLDIKKILSQEGYIDYIMPQIYFGFENETRPFSKTLSEWNNLIKVETIKLIPALAFYKVGSYDKYAKSGSDEWIKNDDIIANQIMEAREVDNYGGFALFRYDYLFDKEKFSDTTAKELENLNDLINKG